MRIGFLGGTFNPVHYGHLRVAEEAASVLGLGRVMFIPAGQPPLKNSGIADVDKRVRMVELAISGNPLFGISRIEADRSGVSYTVDTVRRLKEHHPSDELTFIIGIDAFLELGKWKDAHALVSITDFAVAARPGFTFASLGRFEYVIASDDELAALDNGEIAHVRAELAGGRAAYLIRTTSLNISATGIRAMRAEGMSIRYLLPESVESFIMSEGLYA